MRYRTIVADPPWHYEGVVSSPKSHAANPRGDGKTIVTAFPYRSMTVDQIKSLPVRHLADDDAVLFLWTTSRYLNDAFDVVDAWGFEYRQTLVWHKTGNPSPFGGSVAPNYAEFVLVGRRGTPTVGRMPSSVIQANAPTRGQHSAKPEALLDYVETIAPAPRVELFARRARFGWDYWGDESLGTASLSAAG